MFLLLLTMPGSQADEIDWENLSNKELHDKFQQMMTEQVQDVLNNFEEAMEKITGLEKTFETKLDNKFNELLARLPPPPPAAPNVMRTSIQLLHPQPLLLYILDQLLKLVHAN